MNITDLNSSDFETRQEAETFLFNEIEKWNKKASTSEAHVFLLEICDRLGLEPKVVFE